MWADIARNYKLNPALTDITGYSMGGNAKTKLTSDVQTKVILAGC
jgi:hypothetical protein